MVDIEGYLERKREEINRALLENLPQTGTLAVLEAMRYSLEAGGKRLRPILAIATAETLGLKDSSVTLVGCAIEYIHTYSLIHDDLPAMDDSDLRRGRPSCHRAFGEATAILAGDALLTGAFGLLAKYGRQEGREEKANKITAELAAAAGGEGMIGGQSLDLEAEEQELAPDEIERLAAMKTGALLRASVICGALTADAGVKELEMLGIFGEKIGAAFQIVDDLLDLEGTAEELGKPAGADRVQGKATFPAVLGPEKAGQRAEQLYAEAVAALKGLDRPADLLAGLAERMVYRKK